MTPTSYRVLVMGVSGCGKSLVGRFVAEALEAAFIDGDDHHPAANVAKMARGTPLDDSDRQPWLAALAGLFERYRRQDESVVIACSALKKRYRDRLRSGDSGLKILFLEGSSELLQTRLAAREDHFFKGNRMLASQLADLEAPGAEEAVTLSIALAPGAIAERFVARLRDES
ncbi:gluconokinase [Halomonas sp. HNIBRBA4712]|uniref:gluconokinase n=1 Tax=Halomonas sp. HNIBRBA4712 TaxID=3373087 RepID=UPI0037471FB8